MRTYITGREWSKSFQEFRHALTTKLRKQEREFNIRQGQIKQNSQCQTDREWKRIKNRDFSLSQIKYPVKKNIHIRKRELPRRDQGLGKSLADVTDTVLHKHVSPHHLTRSSNVALNPSQFFRQLPHHERPCRKIVYVCIFFVCLSVGGTASVQTEASSGPAARADRLREMPYEKEQGTLQSSFILVPLALRFHPNPVDCVVDIRQCDGKLPECSTCKRAGVSCIVVDRVTYRQQPRGHVEDLETEIAQLKERIRQLEHDASTRNAEIEQADDQPGPSSNPSIAETRGPNVDVIDSISPENGIGQAPDSGRLFFGNVLQAVLLRADYKQAHGPSESNYRLRVGGSKTSNSSQGTALDIRPLKLPPPEIANQLQNAYFTHRWPALPLLHRPSFLEHHYASVMALRNGASDVSLFLTLMVFALGAIDLKRQDSSFPDHHLEYFRTATQNYMVGMIGSESIETVQGLLLMAAFAVNEHQSVNSWHCIGQAVRMAIDLGLHQSSSSTSFELLTTEMRRRVFWSAYTLDRNISISLGRPYAVRDADINVPLPQPYRDEELVNTMSSPATMQGRALHPLDMSTFIHTIKLRQIQSKIQDVFYPAAVSNVTDESLVYNRRILRAELDDWIAKAPCYSVPTEATFQTPNWFQIAYSHGLLLLYRPSPAAPAVGREELQICADSAISMISSYSSLYAKKKVTYTWIALHSLFMASVTMLYALWVSPEIRRSTRKTVVKSNVMSCLALFDVMSDYWPLAVRCYDIIDRLGSAATALFDAGDACETQNPSGGSPPRGHFGQIDAEYMDWFGTRGSSRLPLSSLNCNMLEENNLGTPSGSMQPNEDFTIPMLNQMDLFQNPYDWFQNGFDMTIPIMTNVFGNEPYSNVPTGNGMQYIPPM
jgi:hypothetical protein